MSTPSELYLLQSSRYDITFPARPAGIQSFASRMAYLLRLKFLATQGALPQFEIYRRQSNEDEKIPREEDSSGCKLPVDDSQGADWKLDVMSFTPVTDFKGCGLLPLQFICPLHRNRTKVRLSRKTDGFLTEVIFLIGSHHEGEEKIVLKPYYLAATKQVGFFV